MNPTEDRMKSIEESLSYHKSAWQDAVDGVIEYEDLAWLLSTLRLTREALKSYANEKNWGNGGFHGERNTVWMGKGLRGSELAKRILEG